MIFDNYLIINEYKSCTNIYLDILSTISGKTVAFNEFLRCSH